MSSWHNLDSVDVGGELWSTEGVLLIKLLLGTETASFSARQCLLLGLFINSVHFCSYWELLQGTQ